MIGHALSKVSNPDRDNIALLRQIDSRILTLGVTVNIRKSFLNDTKDSVFDIVWHSWEQDRVVFK